MDEIITYVKTENLFDDVCHIIDNLSKDLSGRYGKGYTRRALYQYVRFYRMFPEIVYSPSAQSELLSWTHYRVLIQVEDKAARKWYAREAYGQMWSVRTLQRNVSSQYYYRILKTQDKAGVEDELRAEIETQKEFYYLQKKENEEKNGK